MPRLLELFSGTKSMGRAFEKKGWEIISVDNDAKSEPTICCNILNIELDRWPAHHFDVVHASPPCTYYSQARTTGKPVDMRPHDMISLHTVNLINALKPKLFFIENPAFSRIWKLSWLKDLDYKIASYCHYSDWGYQKHTRFATNIGDFWKPRRCKNDCPHVFKTSNNFFRHAQCAQRGPTKEFRGNRFSQKQLYRIPDHLCDEIANACEAFLE